MTRLLGGESIEIEYRPESDFNADELKRLAQFKKLLGQKAIVKVRVLPPGKQGDYNAVYYNEAACAELFCSKPPGWSEVLSPQSHIDIIEKGEGLNRPFYEEWLGRHMGRVKIAAEATTKFALDAAAQNQDGKNGAESESTSSVPGSLSDADSPNRR